MAFYSDFWKYGDRTALISQNTETVTYRQIAVFSDKTGGLIPPRSVIFLFCTNSTGAVCGYLSFLNNRSVPLLLKADIDEALREHLLRVYQPAYVYGPVQMEPIFHKYEKVTEEYGFCLWKTTYDCRQKIHPELALLLTTSGSTGSPKLVRQSYENIQSNAEAIVQYLELDETERPVTTLPMNYTYGLSIINSHIQVGATLLLTEDTLMNRNFWDFFKREEATSFGGVPYTYEILKKLRFFRMDLPSLRTMTQAGGKLSPELHHEFAEYAGNTHRKFVVMYGQTEATARMGYLPPERALEKWGSMGIAIPGGKLWLRDAKGQEITEADVVGELIYEGANVTPGYAECREDLMLGDERHGILETGDMARRDADGFYYITGRKKRFLKIYGNRVNLDETERMVKAEFEDLDCACAGVDDRMYVFVTADGEEKRDMVRSFLSGKTGLNSQAFTVKVIDEIPKSDAGKTLYGKLEEFYDRI